MREGGFSGRRRELEEKFFHERDRELLQALRAQTAAKERRKALSDASGITDDDLLDQLDELGLGSETVVALSLVPLIAVAWADGNIAEKERLAVLAAAEHKGIGKEHPGYPLLERWLKQKPDAGLLTVWKDYVAALSQTLSESARRTLKEDVLGRAQAVAEAAGSLLGLGSKISKSEQAVLRELEQDLG